MNNINNPLELLTILSTNYGCNNNKLSLTTQIRATSNKNLKLTVTVNSPIYEKFFMGKIEKGYVRKVKPYISTWKD